MAKYKKRTQYRKKYPDLSDEIIDVMEKSDRKMEYQQYDLKVERYIVNHDSKTVACIPSREDSYERLMEENRQFADNAESVEDAAVQSIMIKQMRACLKLLTPEEQELVAELYFKGKSEQKYGDMIGLSQKGVSKRLHKILDKLKKMMEK